LLMVFTLALAGCLQASDSVEEQIALGVAQTSVALTQAALASAGGQPPPQAVEADAPAPEIPQAPPAAPGEPTPTHTLTLTPTITLSPTQTLTSTLSVPMVSVSRNTNCRTGPGEPYDIIGALMENEEAEVLGISSDGGTWILKNPDGSGECWLWGYYATVSGPTEGLTVRTPPPTPTPQFRWAGTWSVYSGALGGVLDNFTMTVTVNGSAFSAVIDLGGGAVQQFTGTISDDYLKVTGNFTAPGSSGDFKFYALGTNQFQGNGNHPNIFEWCGARGGAGMPVPCYKP
jgi:hypothetical protein